MAEGAGCRVRNGVDVRYAVIVGVLAALGATSLLRSGSASSTLRESGRSPHYSKEKKDQLTTRHTHKVRPHPIMAGRRFTISESLNTEFGVEKSDPEPGPYMISLTGCSSASTTHRRNRAPSAPSTTL